MNSTHLKPCSVQRFSMTYASHELLNFLIQISIRKKFRKYFLILVICLGFTSSAILMKAVFAHQNRAIAVVAEVSSINDISYKVRSGDTLSGLAEYFGTTVSIIKSKNSLASDMIYIGQILKIPASCIKYTVVAGDSLYSIATRYKTSVSKIKMFNALTSDTLYIGNILLIPYVSTNITVTYITHTVISGDNAWNISIKYGIPQYELLKVNGLTTSSILSIGQKLKIPVYSIPIKPTPGARYGEYLDWWTEAQYVFPIGRQAIIRDFVTGRVFYIKRTIGANHADCEPLTTNDTTIIKALYGGVFSWSPRAIIVETSGRKIAASMSFYPHGIEYVVANGFTGHFDIHFKNSTRHKDGAIDYAHQAKINIAAGIN